MAEPLLVTSTQCRVTIQPPEGVSLDWSPGDMVMDIRHVHTHNDLSEVCGHFTLTLAPRAGQVRTADAAIPLGSLVTIRFVDPTRPQLDPRDAVVMIGRTERQHVSRDWSQRTPRTQITISGRSVASALLTQTWYHSAFQDDPTSGSLRRAAKLLNFFWTSQVTADAMHQDPRHGLAVILKYFLGLPTRGPDRRPPQTPAPAPTAAPVPPTPAPAAPAPLTRGASPRMGKTEHALHMQGQIAQIRAENPAMSVVEAETEIFRRSMQADIAANPTIAPRRRPAPRPAPAAVQAQPPTPPAQPGPAQTPPQPAGSFASPMQDAVSGMQLVNWQIPDVELADVLDINDDAWTLFEEGIRVPITNDVAIAGSVWNMLHIFIDPLFQEFFTRMERGVCAIHFRGKPFEQHEIRRGSRFVPDNDTLWTVPLTPRQVLRMDLERGVGQNLYNIFRVSPLGAQPLLQDPGFVHKVIPTVLTDPKHPANVLRWGPHPLDHRSPYLNGKQTLPETPKEERYGETIQACIHWGKILSYWHGWTPELYGGTLTVVGSPAWNVGLRLRYEGGGDPAEAYIEGVDHEYTYDPASQSGRYLSALRVSRWWTLSGRVDRRWTLGLELAPETAATTDTGGGRNGV